MKWLKWIGIVLGVVVLLLAIGLFWLLGTSSGLRFALDRASGATHGALSVRQVGGRAAGPTHLQGVRYALPGGGAVTIDDVTVDLGITRLLGKTLDVRSLQARGVHVVLPASSKQQPSQGGFSLKPPLPIEIGHAQVADLSVVQAGQPLFRADTVTLAGRWTDQALVLDPLQVRGPDGHVDAQVHLALAPGYPGQGRVQFAWTVGQTRYAGTLTGHSDGRQAVLALGLGAPMRADLDVTLAPRSGAWTGTLRAPAFDPTPLLGKGSLDRLGADLAGSGQRFGGTVHGTLQLNQWTLRLDPLQARLADDLSVLDLKRLVLHSPQIPGTAQAHGTVKLKAQPLAGELQLAWEDVELPAALAGQRLDTHGTLDASGNLKQFQARGRLAVGPPGQLAQVRLDLDGTPERIALHPLALEQPHGHLHAEGTLTLQPALAWQAKIDAASFDPGKLFSGWDGNLDATLATQGSLHGGKPEATLTVDRLGGRLRGRPLRGHGHLHLSPANVLDGTLQLASGRSTVRVAGAPGARNDVEIALDLAALGDWLPQAGGALGGRVHIGGLPPALSLQAHLTGHDLAWGDARAGRLRIDADVPDISAPGGDLAVVGQQLQAAGLAFTRLDLQGHGTEASHRAELTVAGPQVSGHLALRGSLAKGRWQGTLGTLELEPAGLPAWHLTDPTDIRYADGALDVSPLCLSAGEPLLCAQGRQAKDGALDASYRLRAVPIGLLLNAAGYAGLPLRVDGTLHGDGQVHRSRRGELSGHATVQSDAGSMTYTDNATGPLLRWQDFSVTGDLAPDHQTVTADAVLNGDGRLDAKITLAGAAHALDGQVTAHLPSLAPLALLSPEIANVRGRLDAQVALGGTLAQPALNGRVQVERFGAELPTLGLQLADGQFTVTADGSQSLLVAGQVRSGKGVLHVDGSYGLGDAPSAIAVTGDQVTAADMPVAQVVASPAVVLRSADGGWSVVGKVDVDKAEVNLDHLPGGGALQGSPDVVVVDAGQPAQGPQQAAASPLSARVAFDLGQHTHLRGKGVDGTVKGLVTVIEQPGQPTLAEGQLTIDGTYKAYGQDLLIQQGRVLFAHQPIADPGLNIRAVRKLNPNATIDEGQEVGLHITGTAQHPQLEVFSNPTMQQSDALSYLITGKPLSDIGSGESNAVTSAAQTLGSAAGNLLAKSVGTRLGVDEIGVSSNQALGGNSAFTVGKYLSPRLYLSYGVGLFQPGTVITLRYRLSQRWSFEAQNAPDFSRAALNYRIER